MEEKKICLNCKYFGYNNHKPMNDVGDSICLKRKHKVHGCQHCKNFENCKKTLDKEYKN